MATACQFPLNKAGYKFTLAISPLDCMGCSVCVSACPTKSLTMVPIETQLDQQPVFDYTVANVTEKPDDHREDQRHQLSVQEAAA